MRGSNILALLAGGLWLALGIMGADLERGVAARIGHTNQIQLMWGVVFPLSLAAAIAVCAWICSNFPKFQWVSTALSFGALFLSLGYCMLMGGGV